MKSNFPSWTYGLESHLPLHPFNYLASLQEAVAERAVEQAALDRTWGACPTARGRRAGNADHSCAGQKTEGNRGVRVPGQVANRALELIGKEMGMFKDRLEINDIDATTAALIAGRGRGKRMPRKRAKPLTLAELKAQTAKKPGTLLPLRFFDLVQLQENELAELPVGRPLVLQHLGHFGFSELVAARVYRPHSRQLAVFAVT